MREIRKFEVSLANKSPGLKNNKNKVSICDTQNRSYYKKIVFYKLKVLSQKSETTELGKFELLLTEKK